MTQKPKVAERVADLRSEVGRFHAAGEKVAIVPTMGALHAGHLALVREARARAERVVVSIFVNPTQFAPNEDFSRYPRTWDADMRLLADEGVDVVYAPARAEMYPDGFCTRLDVQGPAEGLESDFRPHFFSGVAIVVAKLFLQSEADFAMFGEKDYQQLKVVTRMVRDLDLRIRVVPCATVREPDGLALSSRNRYLTDEDRAKAPAIHRALQAAAAAIHQGQEPDRAAETAADTLSANGFAVDYVAARHAETLAPLEGRAEPVRLLAAVWLGKTRLIDNIGL
ncbi:pantoate--beta-alanine ligase [Aquabacter spiritensis]|uniref:Pantothenate synthetase n=1 Tax=Aquabacter spiritensis TaxID=933073 RepID=A0A4R3LQ84_9HYPH|nr:pantoate--beta-alanine ligase [Aquabacter spiritensis]TCT02653.1 pantothenate synthetase [Aquabacter spiritensis]